MRGVLLAAAVAAAVLTIDSCGLDIWPYLDPPNIVTPMTDINPFFVFKNVATTVAEFRGFELYYKFYSRDQTVQTNLSTVYEMTSAGFRRVCSDSGPVLSQVPPLILVDPADRNTVFTTTGDFTDPNNPAYAHYDGAVPRDITLCRAVEDAGAPKTFDLDSFDPSDADLSGIWDYVQIQNKELHLVMYAFSYGLKDLTSPLYSDAQYLGFMIYYLGT